MIEVVYKGAVVARVGTPAEAAQLIKSLETPAPAPKAPETANTASPWTPEILVAFIKSLSEAGGKMIVALSRNGPSTNTEIGVAMGKENGKGIGPARRLIEKLATDRGLPSPFIDLDGGKIGLTREFSAAIAASRNSGKAEVSM